MSLLLLFKGSGANTFPTALSATTTATSRISLSTRRLLPATAATKPAVTRNTSRSLSGAVTALDAVARRLGKTLTASMAATATTAAALAHVLALAVSVVTSGVLARRIGKLVSGVTAVTAAAQRAAAKALNAAVTVPGTLATTKVKLFAVAAQIVVYGTQQVKVGRVLQGVTTAGGNIAVSVGKKVNGVIVASAAVARNITRNVAGATTVTGVLSSTKVKLLALAAQVIAFANQRTQARFALQGVVTAIGNVTNSLGKRIAGTIVAAGTLTRNVSRNVTGITVATGTVSFIRVKLLALATQVAVAGTAARRVFVNQVGQAVVNAAVIRGNITQRIQGIVTATTNATRGLGKLISGKVAAVAALNAQKVYIIAVSIVMSVAGAVQRKVGSAQATTVTASVSLARRVGRLVKASIVAVPVFSFGRVFFRSLTTTVTAAGSLVLKTTQLTALVVFKFGSFARRWVTGNPKNRWKVGR